MAAQADAIITILTDAAAINSVYEDSSGLLSGDVTGKLFIEMSTVQPDTEIALAKKVRAKGAAFVECPVGGTTGPARQGKLIGLAGAEPADFERARPLLEQLCRRLEHCGPVGAGSTMKLAINMPLMIYWQALGEALAISRHLKFDSARMMDLLADTSGGPNVLKVRGAALAKMLAGEPPAAPAFDLASGIKDLRTMLAEGQRARRGIATYRADAVELRGSRAARAGAATTFPRIRSIGRIARPDRPPHPVSRSFRCRSRSLKPTLSSSAA